LSGRPLASGEVAFRIAPRINAAGRMDVAQDVIELFSTKDPERARALANKLDQLNSERQEEERRILDSIFKRAEEDPALREAYCVVIDGEGWHRGVIGITATRVVERFGRPALVISRDGEDAHGSGRSISAFHLLNALESCAGLFTRYGGHAHAVGFSLPCSHIAELRRHLDQYARAKLTLADFEPMLNVDAELPLGQVSPEFYQLLRKMEPFGVGNPEPVFAAHAARVAAPPRVMKEKHVKLKLSQSQNSDAAAPPTTERNNWRRSIAFNAMGWRMAERFEQEPLLMGDCVDIAFTLDHNDHPDFGGLELSLRDFHNATRPGTSTQDASQAIPQAAASKAST
jgi:single-stranded-DNA-specific exonuclease